MVLGDQPGRPDGMMDVFINTVKPPGTIMLACLSVLYTLLVITSASVGVHFNQERTPSKEKSSDSNVVGISKFYLAAPGKITYTPHGAGLCSGDTFLVIFVCSAVEHFEHRQMIRETWGSFQRQTARSQHGESTGKNQWNCSDELLPYLRATRLIFHIGLSSNNVASVQQDVERERVKYDDVIQGDFVDTYANLSLKSVSMLRWLSLFCQNAKFLMKTDDDVFINLPLLLKDLSNVVHKKFLMGDIITAAQPIRDKDSKWYTPVAAYPHVWYPRYISGASYVISGDLIKTLSDAATGELFWIEDVYITGILAEKVNSTLIFNGKFRYSRRYFHPCFLRLVISAHRLDPTTLQTMWGVIHDPTLGCDYDVL